MTNKLGTYTFTTKDGYTVETVMGIKERQVSWGPGELIRTAFLKVIAPDGTNLTEHKGCGHCETEWTNELVSCEGSTLAETAQFGLELVKCHRKGKDEGTYFWHGGYGCWYLTGEGGSDVNDWMR